MQHSTRTLVLLFIGLLNATQIIIPELASADHPRYGRRFTRSDYFRPTDGGTMGRMMGNRNAARIVGAVWNRLGRSCDQLDRLTNILSETPLARPAQGGAFAACFFMGYTDSIWEEIGKVYDRCGSRCFQAGVEIGNISAQGYCAASIAVGGLFDPGFIAQPPLPFCGQNVAIGCKSEFASVAQFDFPGCYEFTQGTFSETFENSVRLDCFVPADVPIFDDGRMALFEGVEGDLTGLL